MCTNIDNKGPCYVLRGRYVYNISFIRYLWNDNIIVLSFGFLIALLWVSWSLELVLAIFYNYHPCWSVTRGDAPGWLSLSRGDKPSGHTPTRVIIGLLYRIFLHQTPSNRIPVALRQKPSDWIHAVLWPTPSDWIHVVLWPTPSDWIHAVLWQIPSDQLHVALWQTQLYQIRFKIFIWVYNIF